MSEESLHPQYEWAEKFFSNNYDVAPKYRDMLAMLAASLMGNPDAAQHFYNRALVEGATDEELRRTADVARMQNFSIGDLNANIEQAKEEMREDKAAAEERPPDKN